MDRDDLVERVAEEVQRSADLSGIPSTVFFAREVARAALAIIEPAVREECARVALQACAVDPHTAGITAAAIRAGANPS